MLRFAMQPENVLSLTALIDHSPTMTGNLLLLGKPFASEQMYLGMFSKVVGRLVK